MAYGMVRIIGQIFVCVRGFAIIYTWVCDNIYTNILIN